MLKINKNRFLQSVSAEKEPRPWMDSADHVVLERRSSAPRSGYFWNTYNSGETTKTCGGSAGKGPSSALRVLLEGQWQRRDDSKRAPLARIKSKTPNTLIKKHKSETPRSPKSRKPQIGKTKLIELMRWCVDIIVHLLYKVCMHNARCARWGC